MEQHCGIVSRNRAQKIIVVFREGKGAGRVAASSLNLRGRNGLNLLKVRLSVDVLVGLDINITFPLMHDIQVFTVPGYFNVSGCGL